MKHQVGVCEVCSGPHRRARPVQTYDVDMLIAGQAVRMHRPLKLCERCAKRMGDLQIIAAVNLAGMSLSRGTKHVRTTEAPQPDGLSV